MNFFQRLQGIFFNPLETLKALSEKPAWVDVLVFLLIIVSLYSFIIIPYQNKDSLQTWKSNVKLQERLGDESYKRTIERLENPPEWLRYTQSFLMIPFSIFISFLFSSLIILGLGRLFSTEGKYVLVLAAFLHAQLIDKLLGNGLRLTLVLIRKSTMQTSTSLALFFPRLEVSSLAYVILGQFDFFQIWLFGILCYGLSSIFKIELKKALLLSYGFWLLKSIFNIAITLPFLRLMG